MSRQFAVLAIFIGVGLSGIPMRANCKKVDEAQQCLGCAHEIVELEEAKTGTGVRGFVHLSAGLVPPEGVLVEVFTRPENAKPLWGQEENQEAPLRRTRVSACLVKKRRQFPVSPQRSK